MGKRDRVKVVDVLREVAKQDMVKAPTEPTATEPTATEPTATEPTATEPTATEPTTEPTATEPTTEPTATEPTTEPTATTDAPKGAKVRAIERVIGLFPEAKRAGWKVWCQELFYDNANTADRVRIVEEDIQDTTAREAILAIVRGLEPAAPAKGTARKPAKLSAEGAKTAPVATVFKVALVDASLVRVRIMTEHKTRDGAVTSYRVRQVDATGVDLTQTSPDGTTVPSEGTVAPSDLMSELDASAFVARWKRDQDAFHAINVWTSTPTGERIRIFDRGDGTNGYRDGVVTRSVRPGFHILVTWDRANGTEVSRDFTTVEASRVGFRLPSDPTELHARLWRGAVELSRALGDYVPDDVVITALRTMGAGAELSIHPAVKPAAVEVPLSRPWEG